LEIKGVTNEANKEEVISSDKESAGVFSILLFKKYKIIRVSLVRWNAIRFR
jgi:hypothetical protein